MTIQIDFKLSFRPKLREDFGCRLQTELWF